MLDKKDLRGAAVLFGELSLLLTEWADDIDEYRKMKGLEPAADKTLADVLALESDAAETAAPAVVEKSVPAAEEGTAVAADPVAPVVSDDVPVPAPPYTFEAVLEYMRDKIAKGFRTQVEALFNSYGAKKFSEINPAYYGDLVEAVARLGVDFGGDGHA